MRFSGLWNGCEGGMSRCTMWNSDPRTKDLCLIGLQFSVWTCLVPVLFITSIHCLSTLPAINVNSRESLDAFPL